MSGAITVTVILMGAVGFIGLRDFAIASGLDVVDVSWGALNSGLSASWLSRDGL
jgi:hypothetical protein